MTSNTPVSDPFRTPAETAAQLGVTLVILKAWRRTKHGPPAVRLGHRTVRYRQSAIDAWLEQRADA